MERMIMFMDGKAICFKVISCFQTDIQSQCNPKQNPHKYICRKKKDKLIVKFT